LEKYTKEVDETFGWKLINSTDPEKPNIEDYL